VLLAGLINRDITLCKVSLLVFCYICTTTKNKVLHFVNGVVPSDMFMRSLSYIMCQ